MKRLTTAWGACGKLGALRSGNRHLESHSSSRTQHGITPLEPSPYTCLIATRDFVPDATLRACNNTGISRRPGTPEVILEAAALMSERLQSLTSSNGSFVVWLNKRPGGAPPVRF